MRYLETEVVFLRPFEENDLDDIYQYASISGVGESAGWKHHQNKEETKAVLYNFFLAKPGQYAIVEKENKKVIGSFSFKLNTFLSKDFFNEKVVEIGYVFSKEYWNKGIMTALVSMILDALKQNTDFTIVTATTFVDNKASMKVLEKNNFMQYRIINGVYQAPLDEILDMNCFYKRIKK